MPRKRKLSGDALQKVLESRVYDTALTWSHIALRDVLKDMGVPPREQVRITRNAATLMAKPIAEVAVQVAHGLASIKGGVKGGKTRKTTAEEWQAKCIEKAQALVKQKAPRRGLVGILAQRFRRSKPQVRTVLQDAGILPPRKKRKRK